MAGLIEVGSVQLSSSNGNHDTYLKSADTASAINTYNIVGSGVLGPSTNTATVTNSDIDANTYVSIYPLGTNKAGTWTVNSIAGSFVITSTKTETNACYFKWSAIK